MSLNINLPKTCGLRSQAWLWFCLTLRKIIMGSAMDYIINKNMTKETFIINNKFSGYLHSKGVVLSFHLGLQENTLLYQLLRWCDMTLPIWAQTFPILGSLQYLESFLTPSHQVLMVSTSHWHHTFAWGYVGNTLIGP